MESDRFVFRKFRLDADSGLLERCHAAALEKLQTLSPGDAVRTADVATLRIATCAPDAEDGMDTYELGMLDNEIPCMRNCRNDEVITFRVD